MLHALPVPESAVIFGKATANAVVSRVHGGGVRHALRVSDFQRRRRGRAEAISLFLRALPLSDRARDDGAVALPGVRRGESTRATGSSSASRASSRGRSSVDTRTGSTIFRRSVSSDIRTSTGSALCGERSSRRRAYVLILALTLLWAAAGLYPRTPLALRDASRRGMARRRVLLPAALSSRGHARAGRHDLRVGGRRRHRLDRDRAPARRVRAHRAPWLNGRPQPELAGVDLDLDLFPEKGAFRVVGHLPLKNANDAAIDSVHITVNPRLLAKGRSPRRPAVRRVRERDRHVPPRRADGARRHASRSRSSGRAAFPTACRAIRPAWAVIGREGTFLHSFEAVAWLPAIGYQADIEIANDRTRRKYKLDKRESLPEDHGEGRTRAG